MTLCYKVYEALTKKNSSNIHMYLVEGISITSTCTSASWSSKQDMNTINLMHDLIVTH